VHLRRRLSSLTVLGLLVTGGCNGPEPGPAADRAPTTTEPTTTTEGPTTTQATTTTEAARGPGEATPPTSPAGPAFAGVTTPSAAPPPPGSSEVAQLTDVLVQADAGVDRIVFRFADAHLPGYDIAYVDGPVRQDGSGDPVPVEGRGLLQVRFEPASGVDLRGGTFEETYRGPDRLRGATARVTEVVRTGDFEANLTWVVGLDAIAPYRVEVVPAGNAVVVEVGR
jgi:hypothetical protein